MIHLPRYLPLTLILSLLTTLSSSQAAALAGTTATRLATSHSVLELAPSPGNARNSEGSFVTLKDGRLLLIYSHFVGDAFDDHAKAVLAMRTSSDDGETWSGDTILATPGETKAMNVMSVSLVSSMLYETAGTMCARVFVAQQTKGSPGRIPSSAWLPPNIT